VTVAAVPRVDVGAALARGRDALLARQDPAGWWKGELETNVTMDAEDLLLRELLGVRSQVVTERAAHWIRTQQRTDGTWATFHEGPPDLSTTVEAYAALRLAGDPADADHMQKAVAFVRDAGGIERARVFTRIWLALFGECDWSALPTLPPEVMFLPSWCPLNIYDFACWARQTIVPLTIVAASRPVHPLPFSLAELHGDPVAPAPATPWTVEGRFRLLDRGLARYDRRPFRPLRRAALAAAEHWIVDRQEADGSWGGIQPPWVYSLLALSVRGYSLDHPVMRAGLAGLESFVIDDDRGRRLEACQSPVWDTALAVVALADAGVAPDDPALVRAAEFLLRHEVRVAGDWSVRRPGLAPGGWAFEFANVNYPDVDDTAEVVLALRRVEHPDAARVDRAIERAVRWVEAMQCRDGGWAAFDADNTSRACARLPFCDFGEVTDPPSADVTAHALEMLAAEPGADPMRLARGTAWLRRRQEPDGSWFGRWGVNHVYGTGAALPALRAAGDDPGPAPTRAAVRWLEAHQNADGGWGEDIRSYHDAASRGRGASTASQTAWALLALLAADVRDGATERGVRWLVETQRADGTWDEPWFTGTGFPGDFSINYHLYRQVFPVMALGRFARSHGAPGGSQP
jgi:squalene-hopene/tetraprenyl-beta-curcumene cyclase